MKRYIPPNSSFAPETMMNRKTAIGILTGLLLSLLGFGPLTVQAQSAESFMKFGDTSRRGVPFSKDPHVVSFKGRYLMYFSVPPYDDDPASGWNIAIAESRDLLGWETIAEIRPAANASYEQKGLCAPAALVRGDTVHLFYQTYGNGENDAICHAWSTDGISFTRNETNPIFKPAGGWNCGRAIDAEVLAFRGRYLLYFATRDPDFEVQMMGVAAAPLHTNFDRDEWTLLADEPVLYPTLDWEGACVEGASVIERDGRLFMFYAGSYNNSPQQVGLATSNDGIRWKRYSDQPFLPNGKPGEWNSSESGHPHLFEDRDGRTYLFYQGNNDNGKTWYITQEELLWNGSSFDRQASEH